MAQTLDEIDLKILRILQEDCRITNKELAERINLTTTPTFERQKRLERMGYVMKYVAVLDPNKLDRGFEVICNIGMKQINKQIADDFRRQVHSWSEVAECYNVSGDCDYQLKVFVPNMAAYQNFVIEKVGSLDYIARIQSVFIMDTLKMNYGIPV